MFNSSTFIVTNQKDDNLQRRVSRMRAALEAQAQLEVERNFENDDIDYSSSSEASEVIGDILASGSPQSTPHSALSVNVEIEVEIDPPPSSSVSDEELSRIALTRFQSLYPPAPLLFTSRAPDRKATEEGNNIWKPVRPTRRQLNKEFD